MVSVVALMLSACKKDDAEAREKSLTPEGRNTLRLDKSLPTLNAMVKWMTGELKAGNLLPKSPIGKAMHYSLDRWDELSAYLLDGTLEIDNDLIENAIRPLALGRKNYLFAGSHDGAKRTAAIYSFFAMCKTRSNGCATSSRTSATRR